MAFRIFIKPSSSGSPNPNESEPQRAKALAKSQRRQGAQRSDSRFVFGDCGQKMIGKSLQTFAALRLGVDFLAQSGSNRQFSDDTKPA